MPRVDIEALRELVAQRATHAASGYASTASPAVEIAVKLADAVPALLAAYDQQRAFLRDKLAEIVTQRVAELAHFRCVAAPLRTLSALPSGEAPKRTTAEGWASLMSALADSVERLSDEQLLAEAAEDGVDVEAQATRMRAMLTATLERCRARRETPDEARPHIVDGEFQSDKYPTCPRGKVPLSVRDVTAQDLLWEYAQRRRAVDAEFADDLEWALRGAEYVPGATAPPPEVVAAAIAVAENGLTYLCEFGECPLCEATLIVDDHEHDDGCELGAYERAKGEAAMAPNWRCPTCSSTTPHPAGRPCGSSD